MRISDWSSDVCSSDLLVAHEFVEFVGVDVDRNLGARRGAGQPVVDAELVDVAGDRDQIAEHRVAHRRRDFGVRSEEHTSELQSLMRISYAVFCLKKKKYTHINQTANHKQTLH